MDFDKHTVRKIIPRRFRRKCRKRLPKNARIEGMNRDEVLMSMGHPLRKIRETKDGVDLEDWIYGEAPGKVTFVTFANSKVVKVKEMYAGLGIEASPQHSITP